MTKGPAELLVQEELSPIGEKERSETRDGETTKEKNGEEARETLSATMTATDDSEGQRFAPVRQIPNHFLIYSRNVRQLLLTASSMTNGAHHVVNPLISPALSVASVKSEQLCVGPSSCALATHSNGLSSSTQNDSSIEFDAVQEMNRLQLQTTASPLLSTVTKNETISQPCSSMHRATNSLEGRASRPLEKRTTTRAGVLPQRRIRKKKVLQQASVSQILAALSYKLTGTSEALALTPVQRPESRNLHKLSFSTTYLDCSVSQPNSTVNSPEGCGRFYGSEKTNNSCKMPLSPESLDEDFN